MKNSLVDTNVIIRFLVEDPREAPDKFKGVFDFFTKVEIAQIVVEMPELVVFEAFFVLTKLYQVSPKEAAARLQDIISFKGILMRDKHLMQSCLEILRSKTIGLVDAYLLATAREKGIRAVYSYDSDLSKQGLTLLEVR